LCIVFVSIFFWDEFLQPGEKKKEGAKGTKAFYFFEKKMSPSCHIMRKNHEGHQYLEDTFQQVAK
jgi:hypothetical protein